MNKDRARAAVARALRRGDLIRPDVCSRCSKAGTTSDGRAFIHAHHHKGYDNPLDIIWLCPACHFVEDPRPKGEKNGRAILTADMVNEIRRLHIPGQAGGGGCRGGMPGSARFLAIQFGVNQRTIFRVVHKENWIDAALAEK